jgi:hypothetical protein
MGVKLGLSHKRRIFGPKREEVAGAWKRMHNVELHNLYASPNIVFKSRKMRWAGHVALVWEMRNTIFWSEGTRPLGRLMHI